MKELTILESGNELMSLEQGMELSRFLKKLDSMKKEEKEIKEKILARMELLGIKEVEIGAVKITYKFPYDRETFDGRALKKDDPDLYDKYVKITPVKSSVTIKPVKSYETIKAV